MSKLLVRLMSDWVALVERNAKRTLLVLVVLSIASGIYAFLFARINSDLGTLIKPSDELSWYTDNEKYKAAFPELQQTAVVVVSGSDADRVEKTARILVRKLRRLGDFNFVFSPQLDDFLTARKIFFLNGSDFDGWIQAGHYNYGVLLRLADSADMTNAIYTFADQISARRGLPLQDPLASLATSLGAEGGTISLRAYPRLVDTKKDTFYQVVVLKGRQRLDKSLPNEAIVESIRSVVADLFIVEAGVVGAGVGDTQVRLTGEVPLANEEIKAAMSGIGVAGTISLILLAIILGVGIRSKQVIVMIFCLLLMGILLTTGFATLAVGSYNVLSLIFVVMFFGLGVDFAVHFALRIREAATENPAGASQVAVADIGPALVLCMLTSMIAFLSFTPTAYRGLAELGLISAGGMVIAFALTITLLPAVFSVLGIPEASEDLSHAKFDLKLNPKIVLAIVTVLSVFAFSFARDVRFDYSVLAMRDAGTEGMTTLLELQREKIATDYSISVLARDAAEAAALKAKFQALPVVGDVSIPADFLPEEQEFKRAELRSLLELYETIDEVVPAESTDGLADALVYLDESIENIREEDREKVTVMHTRLGALASNPKVLSQMNEQLLAQLTFELGQLRRMLSAQPFGIDDIPGDLKRRMITPEGNHLMTVQPARPLITRQATEDFIREVDSIAPNISGRSVVEWGVGDVVVRAFMMAGTLSLAGIFMVLVLYFRNLVLPVLVLTPIFLALLFTFAVCQISGISLNMANVLVVPLILGLGVDTGIHVVHRFTHSTGVEGVYRSSTARAVLISALTTIGTFFSLSFSPHKGAASVGLLLTIAISLLVLATFIVLPALLRTFRIEHH